MSLKVWQATGGKLAQVLAGHSDAVTCVAVSVNNKNQVISGSKDSNLIVWDIHTGEEIHTLAGHLAQVTCVKVSADGTTAVSGSDDKVLIVWETKRGLALTSLQLHEPFIRFDISLECSRILVHLVKNPTLPVICLHNTPASFIKLPTYSAPARDVEGARARVDFAYNYNSFNSILLFFAQISDQPVPNDRCVDCSRKRSHWTHTRGRRNTATSRRP